MASAAR
jgi:hypothetical protein